MKTYAGIGSRETPTEICTIMTNLAVRLESLGYTLNSGGATGADSAFAKNVKNKHIYVPWRGYNNITTIYDTPSEEAMDIAEQYHPAWNKMGYAGHHLMARNSHIILGEDCKTPVEFVICWTPNGRIVGGTAQGIRIANSKKIPVYNLAIENDIQKLSNFMNTQGK